MATWTELQGRIGPLTPEDRARFVSEQSKIEIKAIADLLNANVLFYASGFLQKPEVPGVYLSISREDINGFMAGIHGLDFSKRLILLLHTPGGSVEAAQTIVEYLREKFDSVEALVPTYAMSAGTIIALGCDQVIMGKQSQLGPIDPQLIVGSRSVAAHSIIDQFEEAKGNIVTNPVLGHAWMPILQAYGPALLQEARRSIAYGQSLVAKWLETYMFADRVTANTDAQTAAEFFSDGGHGSHGMRIDKREAREQKLEIVDLEDDQELQERALTLYHLATIIFEQGPAVRTVLSSNGSIWVKNLQAGN